MLGLNKRLEVLTFPGEKDSDPYKIYKYYTRINAPAQKPKTIIGNGPKMCG
jgi:hypothetical protein